MIKLALFSILLANTAFAGDVTVTGAPPIADAPPAGLDPDVIARLDSVEQEVATGDPEQLLARTLVLYQSADPFSVAQRDAAKPRALQLLTRIGDAATAHGKVIAAARAFDARWTLSGVPDPALASALTSWARREADPSRALYLARRARSADPRSQEAIRLDDDLSSNHRLVAGKVAIVIGIVACAVGIYAYAHEHSIDSDLSSKVRTGPELDQLLAERDRYHWASAGLLIASPVISLGGIGLMMSGAPSYSPESPAELPTLGAR